MNKLILIVLALLFIAAIAYFVMQSKLGENASPEINQPSIEQPIEESSQPQSQPREPMSVPPIPVDRAKPVVE